jgi:hypothetical protein
LKNLHMMELVVNDNVSLVILLEFF